MSNSSPSENTAPVSAFQGPVAELVSQRMLQPPTRPGLLATLDHYEILRLLGGGGMGIVLLARDPKSGRDVAIKLVKPELVTNQHVVHRFLKEAGHLKRLQHTNIIPVLEISDRAEGPYFVMPYFEKGSLANRIKPGEPLDGSAATDIAAQVAEGLAFAHRSGIIHRDLKPANILLGANGQACIGDFGLARTMFNDTIVDVESRHLEGTAPYMSPAVAAGHAEDTRCDIYSFGAVLYEMLTGHVPYQGRGTKEVLDQVLAGPPKPIADLNPAADHRLAVVAETAMARELRDRYAEMRDAANDLHRIKAGKEPFGQSKSRRGWQISVATILFCVLLAVLLSWAYWSKKLASVKRAQVPAGQTQTTTPPLIRQPRPMPTAITLAGQAGNGGTADGAATVAQFRLPNSLATDRAGNIFVADTANNCIRKIAPDGAVSTFAGQAGSQGSADGLGSKARFWAPFGICVDGSSNVIVADTANNTIRKITPAGVVTTIAGMAGRPGKADGMGSAARFRNPWSVAADSAGNIIVADMSNNTIRKIATNGVVTTLAGEAGMAGSADGFAGNARFYDPFGVAVDGADNIYVADSANNTIRKISPNGTVTTMAGLAGFAGNTDGNAGAARFWNPQGIAADAVGNIYVADTGNNIIRHITPKGAVHTVLEPPAPDDAPDGNEDIISFDNPGGVAVDRDGNIYVADTNNHCVRKITVK